LAQANGLTEAQTWARLRERYNGYWWSAGEKVYNPWAILNCVDSRSFRNYWWASGTPGMLLRLAEKLDRPAGDLEGITTSDLALLFDIRDPQAEPLLWQTGYLTIKEARGEFYTLGFPNGEVRQAWFAMMLNRFRTAGRGRDGYTAAGLVLQALEDGDQERFQQALVALVAALPSELHLDREAYYHSLFIVALQAANGRIIPESRTDKGRADAVVETLNYVYVIEFKLGSATEALAQIKAKRYYEPYLADPRPIVLVGVGGFAERQIECAWETIKRAG
jgi:hypothetical protein